MDNLYINDFLSYHFIINDKKVLDNIDFCKKLSFGENYFLGDINYYSEKLLILWKETICSLVKNNNISRIGLALSGGVDSFSTLCNLRETFPDLEIYTFSFIYEDYRGKFEKNFEYISQKLNTKHYNYYYDFDVKNIIKELKIMGNYGNKVGEYGFIINNYLYRNIKKDFPFIEYIMTGDGVDELMGGSSMYRMSLLERTNDISNDYFKNEYELKYFKDNISKYEKEFFYKYGEYYGIEGVEDFSEDVRMKFHKYYDLLDLPCSILKKQLLFSFCFLMQHRKGNFFDTGKNNGFEILTPYYDREFTKKIFALNIPDDFLVNYKQTKVLNRYIGNNFAKKYGLSFDFFDAGIIDFNKEFRKGRDLIISMGYFLKNKNIISEKYYNLIPYFIENVFWFENRMRIYSILNLYVLENLKNLY